MPCCSSCGCSPCRPGCCNYTVELTIGDTTPANFSNVNSTGIGVLDSVDGDNVNFRGVASASPELTATFDAGNHVILLTLDVAAIVATIPQATTTTAGIGETATDGEAQAKASVTAFLTPSNLAALGASNAFAGLIEIATSAETIAGLSTTLAVTPAGLWAALETTGTTTWPDAAARAVLVPDFEGQFGAQLDIDAPFMATGAAAGQWTQIMQIGVTRQINGSTTTFLLTGGSTFLWNSPDLAGVVQFEQLQLVVSSNSTLLIADSSKLNIASTGFWQIDGTDIPANSLLRTTGTNGHPTSDPISNYLSVNNPQAGWGTPSGTLTRTTFASYAGQTVSNPPTQAEMQALDNATRDNSRRLAALITDLMSVRLPQA